MTTLKGNRSISVPKRVCMWSIKFYFRICAASVLILFFTITSLFAQHEVDTLRLNFKNPNDQYGIRCWWWWLNGNVTKAAITNDLLQMKAKGFSGACIVDAGGQNQFGNGDVPEGPMFGSESWKALYLHALKEADRLGLKLSMSIQSGWNLGGPDVKAEDATKQLTWTVVDVKGETSITNIPKPSTRENFYRDIVVIAVPKNKSKYEPIDNLALKSATREGDRSGFFVEDLLHDTKGNSTDRDVLARDVIVLKNRLSGDQLHWRVPSGEWTIMRFGYTVSDAKISTASGKWQGLVVDYMSEASFNRYWNSNVLPLLEIAKPYIGRTLQYLQSDSWELGGINWTENFAAEFKRRRGYEIYQYLPVVAGKIVESRLNTNAFLADFRKTIGDCVADYHYKTFARHARSFGLGLHAESAGPHAGPIDGMKNYSHNAIMMSEFWSPSNHRSSDRERFFVKQASSAAKIYDRPLVAAESFTTIGRHWNDVPWRTMKPAFDRSVCEGLNLVFLHTFTCSPEEMGKPGQEYFAGTHLNPNITWWAFADVFFDYLKRCQYILQNSTPVTDALYYYGDHVPNIGHFKQSDPAGILPGYDYDLINEEQLLKLKVTNKKIVLPSGASYHLLVLPNVKTMSMSALHKIHDLLNAGATIVGKKPEYISSLSFPEDKFHKLVDTIWGKGGDRNIGKGKLIDDTEARHALAKLDVAPDIMMPSNEKFDYIHRVLKDKSGVDSDVYFISNQSELFASGMFSFRVTQTYVQIFDPVTGLVSNVEALADSGRVKLNLHFDPYGALFVVFRSGVKPDVNQDDYAASYQTIAQLDREWKVVFDSSQVTSPVIVFDSLTDWTKSQNQQVQYFSGKATYSNKVTLNKLSGRHYALRLSDVQDVGIAKIWINDKPVAVTWTPPFRVDVTSALNDGENEIRIEVINSWRNRLVGDRGLEQRHRYTKTNVTIRPEWELLSSGLLGPVVLEVVNFNQQRK